MKRRDIRTLLHDLKTRDTRGGGALALENAKLPPVMFDFAGVDRAPRASQKDPHCPSCDERGYDGTPGLDSMGDDPSVMLKAALEWALTGSGRAFDRPNATARLIAYGVSFGIGPTEDLIAAAVSSGVSAARVRALVREIERRFGIRRCASAVHTIAALAVIEARSPQPKPAAEVLPGVN